MKTLLAIIVLICTGTSFAQTKLIFHKSHSGSRISFLKALEGNASNFGDVQFQQVTNAVLDSVIYLNDTSAIMVTSEYCSFVREGEGRRETGMTGNWGDFWHAGRDTVYYHPLFTRQHSLDSIRMVIGTEYFFRNDINTTQFVGYDNNAPKTQKVVKSPSERNGNEVYLILVFVIALLLFSMVPAARSSQAVR